MTSKFGNEIIESYDYVNKCWRGTEIDRFTGEAYPLKYSWSGWNYINDKDERELSERHFSKTISLI